MTAPYQLTIDDNGVYSFSASYDVIYKCRFRNINYILPTTFDSYGIDIYDFEFFPEIKQGGKNVFDANVCLTICSLFDLFFTSNTKVLAYICDSVDGRHLSRSTLFERWYRNNVKDLLKFYPLSIDEEGVVFYGAVLFRHDFPYNDLILPELSNSFKNIAISKFGM